MASPGHGYFLAVGRMKRRADPANRAREQKTFAPCVWIELVIIVIPRLLKKNLRRRGPGEIEALAAQVTQDQRRGVPPAASTVQTRGLPPCVEANAIRVPSGDQTPPRLNESKNVSCFGEPPVIGIT